LDGKIYCSKRCAANTQIYEVEIVSETAKYYNVLWSNNEVSSKLKSKMNLLVEYVKIVDEWRIKANAITTTCSTDISENKSRRDRLRFRKPSSSSKVSLKSAIPCRERSEGKEIPSNACCVCLGILNASNVHCCYGCKHRMHGHIVCRKREMITLDANDNVICHRCKPKL
jgi:hypothetical protein